MQGKEKNYFFSFSNTFQTPILCTLQLPKTHFYVTELTKLSDMWSLRSKYLENLRIKFIPKTSKKTKKDKNIYVIRAICVTCGRFAQNLPKIKKKIFIP